MHRKRNHDADDQNVRADRYPYRGQISRCLGLPDDETAGYAAETVGGGYGGGGEGAFPLTT